MIRFRPVNPDNDLIEGHSSAISKRRGRIFHASMYFADGIDDLKDPTTLVKKAMIMLGERECDWSAEKDFSVYISQLTSSPLIEKVFPRQYELILKERDILLPSSKDSPVSAIRPDRIVITTDEARIIEFKTEKGDSLPVHKRQVDSYKQIICRLFPDKKLVGYIAYFINSVIITV